MSDFPATLRRRAVSTLLGCAMTVAVTSAGAVAGTATSNYNVTATVINACIITSTNLAFGNYDPTLSVNTTASSTVTATCTKGDSANIGMSAGANAASTQRQMKDSAGDLLAYNLYQPPNNTPGSACTYATPTAWGDGTSSTTGSVFTLAVSPSITPRTYNVCGSIPFGQNVPASPSYLDTVTATINF